MKNGIVKEPVSFHRRMVAASLEASRKKHIIHAMLEPDITGIREAVSRYQSHSGEKISITAAAAYCFAQTLKEFPEFICFRKGRNIIRFSSITIGVMVERSINGERVPEPLPLKNAQSLCIMDIHKALRQAQNTPGHSLGEFSGVSWINLIPGFLLCAAVKHFAKNIGMAEKYGVCAVTAVGMFSKTAGWFLPITNATVTMTIGGIRKTTDGREKLCLTLSFDHDIIDGAPAARFVRRLTELLESEHQIGK